MRVPDPVRRKSEGQGYKKGYEIRFVAGSKYELAEIRNALIGSGMALAKPFAKGRQFVQPLYGRESVELFLSWIKKFGS